MAKKAYVWSGSAWVEITSQPSVATATTGNAGIVQLVDSTSSVSTTDAATPNSVKTAYDRGSLGVTNAATAQATADGKAAVATTAPADIAATAAVGTGTTAARADHVHVGVPATRTLTGTAPITVGGVSGTGQALSANLTVAATAATTSAAGVVQLSDSVSTTDSTLAATATAVKSAYDLANAALPGIAGWNFAPSFYSSNIIANIPHYSAIANNAAVAGQVKLMRIVPWKSVTVSNIAIGTAAVSSSGLTLARFGIYTRSGTTFTLVARTNSDTTIGNTSSTKYTRALSTTGGYPATYAMTAGSEYWVGFIFTGTTMPTVLSHTNIATPSSGASIFGYTTYFQSSQTDLPATVTGSTGSTIVHYIEVS